MNYTKLIQRLVRAKWHTSEEKEWWYAKLTIARRKKTTKLFHQQNGRCYYCEQQTWLTEEDRAGAPLRKMATLEHVVVQSKGGTDNLRNLVMACMACNSARGDMCHKRFKELRGDPMRWQTFLHRRVGIKGPVVQKRLKEKELKRRIRRIHRVMELAVLFCLSPAWAKEAQRLQDEYNHGTMGRLTRLKAQAESSMFDLEELDILNPVNSN